MAETSRREILLTLTLAQHAELAEDVAELRRRLGTANVTQTILEAVRRATVAEGERREAS